MQVLPQNDWSATLHGQISYPGGSGADGMALIFQTYGTAALPDKYWFDPTNGTGLGSSFLAINLDTFKNSSGPSTPDSYTNAIQVFDSVSGSNPVGQTEIPTGAGQDLENAGSGDSFTFDLLVDYVASTNTLISQFKRGGSLYATDTQTVDLGSVFGTSGAYMGFWAGSGASAENHDVLTLSFTGSQVVPEPSTCALFALGLGALATRRRNRQAA
ncbi:MAG: hypothetical protein AUJ96_18130 [Armatimonadetes bacterium CG2_30_66_41]|nr:MAG: hypothetical protein AUJ96_18130 [Armatimonadetes bacterium CG2_30_66_41]